MQIKTFNVLLFWFTVKYDNDFKKRKESEDLHLYLLFYILFF